VNQTFADSRILKIWKFVVLELLETIDVP